MTDLPFQKLPSDPSEGYKPLDINLFLPVDLSIHIIRLSPFLVVGVSGVCFYWPGFGLPSQRPMLSY